MALNIYKKGQGYWTRLVSGLGWGTLIAALGLWFFQQFAAIDPAYAIYAQVGSVLAIMLGLGLLLTYHVLFKPKSCEFLIATEGEMKKVNWPSQSEVIGSTWIVVMCIVAFALVLFISDLIWSTLYWIMGVLEVNPFWS